MTDLNEVVKEANNPKWMNDTFALSNMIKMAHAFSMCSYNCCYVADQVVHKCIFVSKNIQRWCGITAEEFVNLNYSEYNKFLIEDEYKMLLEVNSKVNTFFVSLSDAERHKYILSFNSHIKLKGQFFLVHYHIKPLSFTSKGHIHYYLCTLSLSSCKQFGNVTLVDMEKGIKYIYSFQEHVWEEHSMIALTSDERYILFGCANSISNEELGLCLCKSVSSIKAKKRKILSKLEATTMIEAMTTAANMHLI